MLSWDEFVVNLAETDFRDSLKTVGGWLDLALMYLLLLSLLNGLYYQYSRQRKCLGNEYGWGCIEFQALFYVLKINIYFFPNLVILMIVFIMENGETFISIYTHAPEVKFWAEFI